MARLHAQPQRPHGACHQHFALAESRASRAIFTPAAVEPLHFVAQSQRRELESIGAKGVGLDNLRAGFDVGLVHAKNRFRLRGIQLIETALRSHCFVQQRTHRPVGNENGVLQTFVEFLNLQFVFSM